MSDPVYCYPPDHTVLRNLRGIRDQTQLDRVERRVATARARQDLPEGDFELAHLCAIHGYLFQDIYAWAGQIRTVEISKQGHQFQPRRFVETGMADVHRRIRAHDYLRGMTAEAFADLAGELLGDVNYVHPFREGNGRTQLHFLKQLGAKAGHPLDLTKIERDAWMHASRAAHFGDYTPMARAIRTAIGGAERDGPDDAGRTRKRRMRPPR